MRIWLAFGFCFSLTISAQAQFVNGNTLHDYCRNFPASATGYVTGAVDTIMAANENGFVRRTFCLRPNVTAGQVRDTVCQTLNNTPSLRDLDATALVSVSLSQAFPCQ